VLLQLTRLATKVWIERSDPTVSACTARQQSLALSTDFEGRWSRRNNSSAFGRDAKPVHWSPLSCGKEHEPRAKPFDEESGAFLNHEQPTYIKTQPEQCEVSQKRVGRQGFCFPKELRSTVEKYFFVSRLCQPTAPRYRFYAPNVQSRADCSPCLRRLSNGNGNNREG